MNATTEIKAIPCSWIGTRALTDLQRMGALLEIGFKEPDVFVWNHYPTAAETLFRAMVEGRSYLQARHSRRRPAPWLLPLADVMRELPPTVDASPVEQLMAALRDPRSRVRLLLDFGTATEAEPYVALDTWLWQWPAALLQRATR